MFVFRLQFEKQFSDQIVEMKREREEEIRKMNQQWQHRVEELQIQVTHTDSFLRPIKHTVHTLSIIFLSLCCSWRRGEHSQRRWKERERDVTVMERWNE